MAAQRRYEVPADMEYLLVVGVEIASTEFESFCTQRFSLSTLVRFKRLKTSTALVQFGLSLVAGKSEEAARLEFKPAPGTQSIVSFNSTFETPETAFEFIGGLVAELLFYDFVVYLGQRGYLPRSAKDPHEARPRLVAQLRLVDSELSGHISAVRAKHQAALESLPSEGPPSLNQVYKGLMSFTQHLEQGHLDELAETTKWYLDNYAEFPQLVDGALGTLDTQKRIMQIAPPGRPRDRAYDAAFNLIRSGEKDAKGAFEWFCQTEGIARPDKQVRDAFKAAMKRRRKGT